MAMNSNDLATAMKDAVSAYPDGGSDAMKALGKGIEDYIVANCDITYSWLAFMANPPFSPDPTTSFKAKIASSGTDFVCTPATYAEFISKLALFLNGIKIQGADGFSISPLKTGVGTFTAEQLGEFEDPTDGEQAVISAFKLISDGIMAGWNSYVNVAGSGTHGSFTGGATLVSVA